MIEKLLFLLITLFIMKCSNDTNADLNGTWFLSEYCFSIGDGKCSLRDADFEQTFVINYESFSYASNNVKCTGIYHRDDNILTLNNLTPKKCLSDKMFLKRIDKNTLEINPWCTEPCRYIYKKKEGL